MSDTAEKLVELKTEVFIPAGFFGEDWARQTYGDGYKKVFINGKVSKLFQRKSVSKCNVRFEDGDVLEFDVDFLKDYLASNPIDEDEDWITAVEGSDDDGGVYESKEEENILGGETTGSESEGDDEDVIEGAKEDIIESGTKSTLELGTYWSQRYHDICWFVDCNESWS